MLECLLTLIPWIEGRYSIILCSLRHPPFLCFICCTFLNLLIPIYVWFFLNKIHPLLYNKLKIYKSLFDFVVKLELKRRKMSYIGLFLFTFVPLPFSGAYSASLISYLLNLDLRKAYVSIALGVVLINLLITYTIIFFNESV